MKSRARLICWLGTGRASHTSVTLPHEHRFCNFNHTHFYSREALRKTQPPIQPSFVAFKLGASRLGQGLVTATDIILPGIKVPVHTVESDFESVHPPVKVVAMSRTKACAP